MKGRNLSGLQDGLEPGVENCWEPRPYASPDSSVFQTRCGNFDEQRENIGTVRQ